jgi:hypothetical protein
VKSCEEVYGGKYRSRSAMEGHIDSLNKGRQSFAVVGFNQSPLVGFNQSPFVVGRMAPHATS